MKNILMVLLLVLGFSSLIFAQNTPQKILSSKTSDGLCAWHLTDGSISADGGSKTSHWEGRKKVTGPQQKTREKKVIRIQADLSKLSHARIRKSIIGGCPEAHNVRTMYN